MDWFLYDSGLHPVMRELKKMKKKKRNISTFILFKGEKNNGKKLFFLSFQILRKVEIHL